MNYRLSLLALLALQVSVNANADQRVVFQPAVEKIVLDGSKSWDARMYKQQDLLMTAKKYLMTSETITYVQYSCEDQTADGSKGDWNGFYTVPSSQKANALAKSIKGVGNKTAVGLVPYFADGKPRSWSAFVKVIQSAEKELARSGFDTGWAANVVYRFKEDNIRNLGYLGGDCQATVKSFTVSNREYLGENIALVKVKASNFSLLPGEKENLTVTYNGKSVITENTENYNQVSTRISYSDYGYRYHTAATVEFRANRIRANLDNRLLSASYDSNGHLKFTQTAYSEMLRNPEFRSKCKIIATVNVIGDSGSLWRRDERALLTPVQVELNLQKVNTFANLNVSGLSKDEDLVVKYTLSASQSCPFYNTKPTLVSVAREASR
jgi:hypothetical protein